ncbi:competence protein ComJ [Rhizobium halophytocola]|uniref:Competence protein J (ComJ) n=1 Tax=Rhizobium halophytocola TaxID=735519 RepID=A0ABS4E660_9HYPH|nr:competence protein ComJ [Rhizobium halophytocola]MBP1853432.1 hypothetical protein [Rhizobium halophytocola]
MIAEFPLTVLYTQVVVHLADLPRPGLLWDDEHVAQGFAWSEGIVSFGVPDHDGECLVMVDSAQAVEVASSAYWAIQVPFVVDAKPLKVGTIGAMRDIRVPTGQYNLVFQALPGDAAKDQAFTLALTFVESDAPDFAILRQGDELETDQVLRRDAEHA